MENKQNSAVLLNTCESFCPHSHPAKKAITPHSLCHKFYTIESLYGKSQSLFDTQLTVLSETIQNNKQLLYQSMQQSQNSTDKAFEYITQVENDNISYTKNLPFHCSCKEKQQNKILLQSTFNQKFVKQSQNYITTQQVIHGKLSDNKSKLLSLSEQIAIAQNQHEQEMSELVHYLDKSVSEIQDTVQQLGNQQNETCFQMQGNYLALAASLELEIKGQMECGRRDRLLVEKLLEKLIGKMVVM